MRNFLPAFFFIPVYFFQTFQVLAQEGIRIEKNNSPNAVILDSTNLPIIAIYTNSQTIIDEPKITADMAIIDNGYNIYNHVTDTNFTYYGKIGIEMRGSITQTSYWPQKSYSIETRDLSGEDTDVSLLGMPEESDWILYGPYDDHALMRNVLTYELLRQMGYWAPRTKYCELLLNTTSVWNYKGVYVMMEKIKRDVNRVDISKLDMDDNAGDSLSGGYIFAIDRNINKPDSGFLSSHPQNTNVFYTYKYPKGDEITAQQETYIQAYMDSVESILSSPDFADPVSGYRKYIEPVSFMDFFLFQELSKNIDAYKRSAYFYKDKYSKGGKLIAGPHWDYNSAWGIVFCGFEVDTGWTYPLTCWINQDFPVPFWWTRMLEDTSYTHDLKCRWEFLRSTVLDTINVFHKIDSISNYVSTASVRQFAQYNITSTLQADVNVLKTWFRKRLAWLDAHMPGNCWNTGVNTNETIKNSLAVSPNPSSGRFNIHSPKITIQKAEVYDMYGRKVQAFYPEAEITSIDISNHPAGIYFLRCFSDTQEMSLKIVKTN